MSSDIEELKGELLIKYGLPPGYPKDAELSKWLETVTQLLESGTDFDEAADEAAKKCFSGYRTHKYGSQAQNLAYLLKKITSK